MSKSSSSCTYHCNAHTHWLVTCNLKCHFSKSLGVIRSQITLISPKPSSGCVLTLRPTIKAITTKSITQHHDSFFTLTVTCAVLVLAIQFLVSFVKFCHLLPVPPKYHISVTYPVSPNMLCVLIGVLFLFLLTLFHPDVR